MNEEKIKESKEKYSPQARLILENLKSDFPFDQFEEWVRNEKFIIGGGYVIEFLELSKEKAENENRKLLNLPHV